jgi:hypothetical protein
MYKPKKWEQLLYSAPTLGNQASLPTKYIVSSFSKYGKTV